MLVATIDVGTNSVKLLLAEVCPPEIVPVMEKVVVTRLGEGLSRAGRIGPIPAERTFVQVNDFLESLHPFPVQKICLAGTRAFRAAQNGKEIMKEWKRALTIPTRILSGREEARLAFLAACPNHPSTTTAIDIGGGSTEISYGKKGTLLQFRSLTMGAVSLTEELLYGNPPTSEQIMEAKTFIRTQLNRLPPITKELTGVGGTIATALGIRLRKNPTPPNVHNRTLPLDEVKRLFHRLIRKRLEKRLTMRGLSPGRADILPAGLLILQEYMEWSHHDQLRVSSHGLRHGLALHLAKR
jgi:exopolyphosphatase/guanosine-5'-triphosphate,3'-diphosphate pyrophosphatase